MTIDNIHDRLQLIVSNVANQENKVLHGSCTLTGDLLLESEHGAYDAW